MIGSFASVGSTVDVALTDDERKQRLDDLTALIDMIRPAVQQDGGDLILVEANVESGEVEVMLQGSCSSCAISTTTLKAGIDRILKDRLSWVTRRSTRPCGSRQMSSGGNTSTMGGSSIEIECTEDDCLAPTDARRSR